MDSLLPALWGPGGYLIKIQEIFKKPDLGESWKGSCFMDIASALFNRAFEELAEFRIALQELFLIQIVNMPAISFAIILRQIPVQSDFQSGWYKGGYQEEFAEVPDIPKVLVFHHHLQSS